MRYKPRWLAATMVCVALTCPLPGRAQEQVHPPAGNTGGPIRIAVLSDRYTASVTDQNAFINAVKNLILAQLLNDANYLPYKADITVIQFFVPWTATPATPHSNYGFLPNAAHCRDADWDPVPASTAVFEATQKVAPYRTIVIGNEPGDSEGCAFDHWVYATSGASGQRVLRHEMGHGLGALYDEYYAAALQNTNYVGVHGHLDDRNCSTSATPHWTYWGLSGVANHPACALYGQGIHHPFATCLMNSTGASLCEVCRRTLKERVDGLLSRPAVPTDLRIIKAGFASPSMLSQPTVVQPAQPIALPGQQMVRLLMGLDRATNSLVIRSATDVGGGYLADYERTGRYAYEVSDGGKPLALGYLNGDPFQARRYPGGTQRHDATSTRSASFIVSIPGETLQALRGASRAVQLSVYLLAPSVTDRVIPPDVFLALKQKNLVKPVAQLLPAEFRKMLP